MGKSAAVVIAIVAIVFTNCAYSQTAPIPEVAELQAKYDEKVGLEVLRPHELAVADLNAKYAAALERAQESAQKAGNLDAAFAIKEEKEAVSSGKLMTQLDDAKAPVSLKSMRATYQTALARLEVERDKNLLPLKDAYARSLEALTVTLTKSGRLEEAMALKKMREDLLASKGGAALAASDPSGKSFTNSLGMKFVKVPGTKVLFCIHETRRQDYEAYVAENPNADASWKNQVSAGVPVGDKNDHPVVSVNLDDAQKFCSWLSKKEGKQYRLPTDREWSVAVGIGNEEKTTPTSTPAMLNQQIQDAFPWGGDFPPQSKDLAGNYADSAALEKMPKRLVIKNYTDGFATTAPVMSLKPNKMGLYDMGGNVWEVVSDSFSPGIVEYVLRGGCWHDHERLFLLSSCRVHHKPETRHNDGGFRCVVEPSPGK